MNDLTCDSDGCVENYVDQDGVSKTLMLHAPQRDEPYVLGIFLVGANQEILGDMHKLYGDTDAVNGSVSPDGHCCLAEPECGDSVDELLRYVHFDPDEVLNTYLRSLREQGVSEASVESHYRELKAALRRYTYPGSRPFDRDASSRLSIVMSDVLRMRSACEADGRLLTLKIDGLIAWQRSAQ